jgi:prepilin-type N-terminal cleavage/methylation domain-containing protein
MLHTKQGQAGFTLLELLVAIAIIGLLATVILASLSPARERARNAQVLSQMYEYQKALDLYYLNTGRYPSGHTGAAFSRGRLYCIGDEYSGGYPCIGGPAYDTLQVSEIETALVPDYISRISYISQGTDILNNQIGSPAYRGCSRLETPPTTSQFPALNINVLFPTPQPDCTDQDYSLFFVLEGTGQDCGRAHEVSPNYLGRGYTLCQISSAQN